MISATLHRLLARSTVTEAARQVASEMAAMPSPDERVIMIEELVD